MENVQKDRDCGLASVLLRMSMACLLLTIAYHENRYGSQVILTKLYAMFPSHLMPDVLLRFTAKMLVFTQTVLAVWLLTGWKLRVSWFFSGLFILSLCFGLLMGKQYVYAYLNFVFLVVIAMGLTLRKHDPLQS